MSAGKRAICIVLAANGFSNLDKLRIRTNGHDRRPKRRRRRHAHHGRPDARREFREALRAGLEARRGRKGIDTYCRLNAQAIYDLVLTHNQRSEVRRELKRWVTARDETLRDVAEHEGQDEAERFADLDHPEHLPVRTCALCYGQLIAGIVRRT